MCPGSGPQGDLFPQQPGLFCLFDATALVQAKGPLAVTTDGTIPVNFQPRSLPLSFLLPFFNAYHALVAL